MLLPRRRRAVLAAPVLLALVAARPADAQPAAATSEPVPATSSQPPVPADSSQPADGILDVVLPCGLRVLAAQDLSLPVAAVVLAVEVGTEDDPIEYPGLVHALAYHLHQGNRELRPGETIAAAQDAGGLHMLSTGPGQVRFESVVPISRLDEVLFTESQRLRFPTIDRRRWDISLGWAASDVRDKPRLRPRDLAALHGAAGLAHDGRVADKALAEIAPAALAAQLTEKFSYARSTLIVVGAESPADIVEQVRAKFADLPPAARALPNRLPPPARTPLPAPGSETAPAVPTGAAASVPLPAKISHLAWPVPPNSAAALWAAATCRAFNRQKRDPQEPNKARVACEYDPDPRRGLLFVRPIGSDDPVGLVRARLARLAAADQSLVAAQAQVVGQALRLYTRSPLGLARQLAATAPSPPPPVPGATPVLRRRDEVLGLATLGGRTPFTLAVEDALLIGPEAKK